jgi:hypothetical protein
MGLVLISTLSYPLLCVIDKSEFEGFASRSYLRKMGNAHVTLVICAVAPAAKAKLLQRRTAGHRGGLPA